MKIAVEGCCHGELDKIYETLAYLEQSNDIKVDLLLICGDFQAVRNKSDLQAMAVPQKYQKMNTFWKYYAGEKTAPVLTVFIGGNHEASNYLQELPYGGWVAPNIYYMGYAGVIQCGGVRIGGISGIYKGRDLNAGHYEHPPYSEATKRTCYHTRSLEVFRLKQIKQPIDIFLSHDWPRGVYNHGNVNALLKKKSFFREEVESNTLGSPAAEELLNYLKPDYWFSAHLHVKFAAMVEHKLASGQTKHTKFLALDKCLPRRKFLQVIDVPTDSKKPIELELDPEWLCVLKATNHLLNLSKGTRYMPGIGCRERYDFSTSDESLKALSDDFGGFFKIPDNFEKTADMYNLQGPKNVAVPQILINPQTTLLCEMLALTDPFAVFSGKQQHDTTTVEQSPYGDQTNLEQSPYSDHSVLDDSALADDSALVEDSDFIDDTLDMSTVDTTLETTANPDEISLDDIDERDEGSYTAGLSPSRARDANVSLPAPKFSMSELSKTRIPSNPDEISVDVDESSISDKQTPSDNKHNVSVESDSSISSGKRSISMDMDTPSSITGDEASPTKEKKFKRRNLSLYANDEES